MKGSAVCWAIGWEARWDSNCDLCKLGTRGLACDPILFGGWNTKSRRTKTKSGLIYGNGAIGGVGDGMSNSMKRRWMVWDWVVVLYQVLKEFGVAWERKLRRFTEFTVHGGVDPLLSLGHLLQTSLHRGHSFDAIRYKGIRVSVQSKPNRINQTAKQPKSVKSLNIPHQRQKLAKQRETSHSRCQWCVCL